jgi:prepilin-type N-terminal cleavage/methylation domain-containing protein
MGKKGFTLVEVLVAMAIGGILIWGTVVAIHQVVLGTARTNSQVVTATDVHHAALYLKRDMQMAQTAYLLGGTTITLSWTDYTSFEGTEPQEHSSRYALVGKELRRTYDGITSVVGRDITSVSFTLASRVIRVTITSTKGDMAPRSKTLVFSTYMRAEGLPE